MRRFQFVILGLFLAGSLSLHSQDTVKEPPSPKAKYVFLFIGDGMGQAQVNLSEAYNATLDGQALKFRHLSFSKFPAVGYCSTNSASSLVTESASAGTALATGNKTSDGRISMGPNGDTAYTTIAEKAKKAGKKIGIVTSVSIDHATPAVFYAHNPNRNNYFEIGLDLVNSDFDYFAGGGFLEPVGTYKGKKINLVEEARNKDFNVVETVSDFKNVTAQQKVIVLAPSKGDEQSLPYSLGSNPQDLTLADLTEKGIRIINNQDGFFMMVEGGKIDWACHANDAATAIHEVLAFDKAIRQALEFYKQFPEETLIIVTADHETGGLSIGNDQVNRSTHINLLQLQKWSEESFRPFIQAMVMKKSGNMDQDFQRLLELLERDFGLNSESNQTLLTSKEKKELRTAFEETLKSASPEKDNQYGTTDLITATAIRILDTKAGVGWTSHNHTGVSVPVYAIGSGAGNFSHYIDNTDIPKIIEKLMGLSSKGPTVSKDE